MISSTNQAEAIAKVTAITSLLHRLNESDLDRIHTFVAGIAQSRRGKVLKRRQRWPAPTQSFQVKE